MDYKKESLILHEKNRGKIEVTSKVRVKTQDDLSLAYTPGVAEPCLKIHENEEDVYRYTSKGNMVAVVSDGSAVLGLGNIGAKAAIPVMEGKAVLFKEFGGVDAFPICLDTQDVDEIVRTVKLLEPVFGGINLEDIASPRCFEIEERLKKELDIPVFHDDQHGTAIVVTAGVINASKLAGKRMEDLEIVINGAGAAGIAICKMLLNMKVKNVVLCDRYGILEESQDLNWAQKDMLKYTNRNSEKGSLKDAMKGKDVFIGVSRANLVDREMVRSMNEKPIVFAMANPNPEILPDEAKAGGAFVMGTGRSDYPNQVNNLLAFPGVFKGAFMCRARCINEEMKVAAANAIAGFIPEEELGVENILPKSFASGVGEKISEAVRDAAVASGVARI